MKIKYDEYGQLKKLIVTRREEQERDVKRRCMETSVVHGGRGRYGGPVSRVLACKLRNDGY